jgi:hypothetical protein
LYDVRDIKVLMGPETENKVTSLHFIYRGGKGEGILFLKRRKVGEKVKLMKQEVKDSQGK